MRTIYTMADSVPPLQSPNTDLIFAFIHDGGGRLSEGCNYIDSVEIVDGQPKRTVRWNVDGDHPASLEADKIDSNTLAALYDLAQQSGSKEAFLTAAEGTRARDTIQMVFEDFRKAWNDEKWQKANPEHPVTVLKKRRDRHYELRGWLKGKKPLLEIRKGNRVLFLDNENCPKDKADKLRAML